jgi:hypothetical protein
VGQSAGAAALAKPVRDRQPGEVCPSCRTLRPILQRSNHA